MEQAGWEQQQESERQEWDELWAKQPALMRELHYLQREIDK
jgi:hypothetical protein